MNTQWLVDSISQWRRLEESPYLIQPHPDDLKRKPSDAGEKLESVRSEGSLSSSELEDDDDESGDYDEGEEKDEDEEDLVPADLGNDSSPVDGFQGYDWKGVEDDLADFLGSDDEDSDEESIVSGSTGGNTTPKKRKRSRSASQTREAPERSRTNGNNLASPAGKASTACENKVHGTENRCYASG